MPQNFDLSEKYVSTTEAAEISGLSSRQIKTLCLNGCIPAQKIGRNYAVSREWAEEYRDRHLAGISVQDAARIAGVSRTAIYLACRRGEIIKEGNLILRDSLMQYIEKRPQPRG